RPPIARVSIARPTADAKGCAVGPAGAAAEEPELRAIALRRCRPRLTWTVSAGLVQPANRGSVVVKPEGGAGVREHYALPDAPADERATVPARRAGSDRRPRPIPWLSQLLRRPVLRDRGGRDQRPGRRSRVRAGAPAVRPVTREILGDILV